MPSPVRTIGNLETPALVVVESILHANLAAVARLAFKAGVRLRPHVKTHKCPSIALLQQRSGAQGFTAATLAEVEMLLDAGLDDIFLAYPVVGEPRLTHLGRLLGRGRILATIDHSAQVSPLAELAKRARVRLDVRLEIDCGHHRCGLPPGDELIALGREIAAHPALRLEGVFTHAGHGYGARSSEELEEIGRGEGEAVVAAAACLRKAGLEVLSVSAGSTPTLPFCSKVPGVTEVRPGNYVFNDGIQVALGVADPSQCALRVSATVISVFPDRFVIDAGSKAFGLDKGAHGIESAKGYGRIIGHEGFELARLSEEHGVAVRHEWADPPFPEVGDRLEIIPNHACAAVNLGSTLFPVDALSGEIRGEWPVLARR